MEASIGVDIATGIRSNGATTRRITTDEDTTIIKSLREKVPGRKQIQKGSDANHVKKIFVKDLMQKKKDPSLSFKSQRGVLTKEQCRLFGSYLYNCIQAHHQDSMALKDSFQRMISHIWGNHSQCGPWCSSKKLWSKETMNIYIGEQLSEDGQIPSLKLLAVTTILTQNVNWNG